MSGWSFCFDSHFHGNVMILNRLLTFSSTFAIRNWRNRPWLRAWIDVESDLASKHSHSPCLSGRCAVVHVASLLTVLSLAKEKRIAFKTKAPAIFLSALHFNDCWFCGLGRLCLKRIQEKKKSWKKREHTGWEDCWVSVLPSRFFYILL